MMLKGGDCGWVGVTDGPGQGPGGWSCICAIWGLGSWPGRPRDTVQ